MVNTSWALTKAWLFAKHLPYFMKFSQILWFYPFYRGGKWGFEKYSVIYYIIKGHSIGRNGMRHRTDGLSPISLSRVWNWGLVSCPQRAGLPTLVPQTCINTIIFLSLRTPDGCLCCRQHGRYLSLTRGQSRALNQWISVDRDFPGGPMVKNPPGNGGDAGSIPGQRTKVLHAHRVTKPHASIAEPRSCGAYALWEKIPRATTKTQCSPKQNKFKKMISVDR